MHFYYVYLVRRFVFIMIAYYLKDYIYFQLMLNTLLNISYLMYIFNAMPFELRNLNYLEIFNECFILLTSYLILGFSDWI